KRASGPGGQDNGRQATEKRSSGNLYGLHQQGLHGGRQSPKTAMAYEDARRPSPSRPGALQGPAGMETGPCIGSGSQKTGHSGMSAQQGAAQRCGITTTEL